MNKFLQKIRQKIPVQTLRANILTIFLSLTIVTFLAVISYSYFRNYNSIQEYAKKAMQQVSATILEKIRNIGMEVDSTLNDSSGVLLSKKTINLTDPDLINFMLNVVNFNIEISSFTIALPTGDVLKTNDVSLSTQTHFISDPSKPLPADTRFVIKYVHESKKPAEETWTYVDQSYKPLATEKLPYITIDVHTRPWYTGALKSKNIYWSDPYYLSGTQELGVGAGKAMYDYKGHLLGVLGINLSFISLSKFTLTQKVSRSGNVLIIDDQGKIVLPEQKNLPTTQTPKMAAVAWKNYQKNSQNSFMFDYKSKSYLAYISKLPGDFGKNWSVLVIAPFLDFFGILIRTQIEIVLITLGILLIAIFIIAYSAKRISTPIVSLSKEIDKITNLDLSSKKRIHSHIIEINMIDFSIDAMRSTLRSFSRYVPKEIVRKLLLKHKDIGLKVEKKPLTILFSDIQDFTTIAETHHLDKVMDILASYFDGLSKIILENKGTIDKYIGDSIMAFWGAPLDDPQHAEDACRTALLCNHFLKKFNQNQQKNNLPVFNTRFGINSGEVLVGNIGTRERMNYTVIGDPVNLASRLESIGKIYHVEIIISDQVYQKINQQFLCRPLDKIAVKGKRQETEIYQLIALLSSGTEISATLDNIKLSENFTRAYQTFRAGDLAEAKVLFQGIQKEFPDDYPTQIYLERIIQAQQA